VAQKSEARGFDTYYRPISEVHNLFGPRAAVYYFLVHSRVEDKLLAELLRVAYKNRIGLNFSLFIALGWILLPSELFWIVISCKIVNSSVKFKFIHNISVIQETFFRFFNLLRGPDKTPWGTGSGPQAAICASMAYYSPIRLTYAAFHSHVEI